MGIMPMWIYSCILILPTTLRCCPLPQRFVQWRGYSDHFVIKMWVCMYVCVWMLAWQNKNPWSEWLETWHISSPRHYVEACWSRVQKVKGQEHRVIILKFWHSFHISGTGAATKFRFCAQMHYGRLLPAGQKLCQNAAAVAEYNSLWKIYPRLTQCAIKWKREMIFPWHFVQRLAHSVMSLSCRATLHFESAWICIFTECAF